MEKWKQINGYDGLYEVSDLGNVRRVAGISCKKTRLVRSYKTYRGYYRVILCKNHHPKNHYVHRLVAVAFVKNKNASYKCINHKDLDQTNNIPLNLEWCTQKQNVRHYWAARRAA